jgi:hypothetical protein
MDQVQPIARNQVVQPDIEFAEIGNALLFPQLAFVLCQNTFWAP